MSHSVQEAVNRPPTSSCRECEAFQSRTSPIGRVVSGEVALSLREVLVPSVIVLFVVTTVQNNRGELRSVSTLIGINYRIREWSNN